jgi:Flp pilus assembly protein TadD
MTQTLSPFRRSARLIPIFSVIIIAQAVSGCILNSKSQDNTLSGDGSLVTGSLGSEGALLQKSNEWAAKWQKNPTDTGIAIKYAGSLRDLGSTRKAVQVLQQASLTSPNNQAVIAEYGKALSNNGQLEQALLNLNRAQTLGSPDWRIYSAQGITLDKMAQYSKARQYYKSALNLSPNQAIVLNNIGLSYALDGNLKNAETYLRRAAAAKGSQPKIQRNLALVLGLSGKFSQSAKTSNKVLSAEDTSVNIAYLKNMLSAPGTWQKLSGKTKIAKSSPRKTKKQQVSKPRKITSLKKPEKAASLEVDADRNSSAKSGDRLSSFSEKIKNALVSRQKTASIDQLDLRTN